MALAWISGAFQRFVGFLTGNQPEEDIAPSSARREMAPGSSTIGSYSPEEVEAAHGELFDNEYRRKAQEHARLRAECFKKADEARKSGDHATANDYVNQAKEHTHKMNKANEEAVAYIMRINPNNKKPNTIDLHGLRVDEAIEQTDQKLKGASKGTLRIIPGRGSHSVNQEAKIKPKLKELLQQRNYSFTEENAGSFIVTIT